MEKRNCDLELVAAFWSSMVLRTDFRDAAEYFGRKIYFAKILRAKATLIS